MSNTKYKAYTLQNFRKLPQIQQIPEEQKFSMEVVGHVFPLKSNNYVVEELINWDNVPGDPIFVLTFPQKEMLNFYHFEKMAAVLRKGSNKQEIQNASNKIRMELNPHPAGQIEQNVPSLNGQKLKGVQHKYSETVLFFPCQGQTCHAYCSFCFRWPQFVWSNDLKFAGKETEQLIEYVHNHPEITDILITGGDPLFMSTSNLATYVRALLNADTHNLSTIRIGTKVLGYWPYRFLTDSDADDLLALFKEVTRAGKHLAIMAHFNHPRELKTKAVKKAISRILETGAQIRTQSPLLANINDDPKIWSEMWNEQVNLGCIPYYMFLVRDTGAQHYFGISLVEAIDIYQKAYRNVSGLSRTVRGPIMSCTPGKVQILGTSEVYGEKVFVLQFLQGRNPDWVRRPFFAKYDEKAMWFDDLKPAFGESKFFFEKNIDDIKFSYRDSEKGLRKETFAFS
tara:strand:+ start:11143 stop:12504 length:1362 start_codon:yes stop_codon:yes gene_type:complete